MDIGERIKKARKDKGLSQIKVADTAGIALNSLRLYEAGKRKPHIERLQRIAAALEVSVTDLIDIENAGANANEVVNKSEVKLKCPDLLPGEFNEFERFIETLGYYTRLDGDNYRLHKGKVSVVVTPDELKALVRASRATVAALVQDLMETATPPPDAPETPPEGE